MDLQLNWEQSELLSLPFLYCVSCSVFRALEDRVQPSLSQYLLPRCPNDIKEVKFSTRHVVLLE